MRLGHTVTLGTTEAQSQTMGVRLQVTTGGAPGPEQGSCRAESGHVGPPMGLSSA